MSATAESAQIVDLVFDLEPSDAQFKVDRPRRQLHGLVLPWGKVATNAFGRWRFERGSVAWGDVSRVKLLRDHNPLSPVGVALKLEDRADGLYGTFSVARGAAGDDVLSLAEDGVLDGFSAGPRIEPDGWEYDSQDRDVRLVTAARLAETTVTAFPAYDDARVSSVRMSLINGRESDMADTKVGDNKGTEPTVLEGQDSAIAKFREELDQRFEAVTTKVAESQEKQVEQVAGTISAAFDAAFAQLQGSGASGRAESAAARWKVVKEPPTYLFGRGGMGAPSMIRDSWRAHFNRDPESYERLIKFQRQQDDLVKLTATGDVPEIIPPGYRPDLFVTQLRQGRPIVSAFSRGTITDATPFAVPVFGSAAGAVGDHTEGTNPTAGTLAMDTTTVSPGAISGTFRLTREVVDASNPAIDAIALAAMREDYNRQTEQKAYTALNTAAGVQSGTASDPTDGAANIAAIRLRLADYPFVRFGAPTGLLIARAATRGLATAVGTDGRPLLPSVGAENTSGVGNAVQQGWFIDGLAAVPAWAFTEGVGDAHTVGLNMADVWAWESPMLTFRFEERSGPAHVDLALFAYYATHVLRPAGVFKIPRA